MKAYLFNQVTKENQIKYLSVNFVEIANYLLNQLFEIIQFNVDKCVGDAKFAVAMESEIKDNLLSLPGSII